MRRSVDDHDSLGRPCDLCGLAVPARMYYDTGPRARLCEGCALLAPRTEMVDLLRRSIGAIARRYVVEDTRAKREVKALA